MRGTVKLVNTLRCHSDSGVRIVTDAGTEIPILIGKRAKELTRMEGAPVDVRGALIILDDGSRALDVERIQLLFPMQDDFTYGWFEAGPLEPCLPEGFQGYRY